MAVKRLEALRIGDIISTRFRELQNDVKMKVYDISNVGCFMFRIDCRYIDSGTQKYLLGFRDQEVEVIEEANYD